MGWRYMLPWLLIAGLFACLLIGWAIAYRYDRRQQEAEDVRRKVQEDADEG